jgi:hypothetical protein
MTKKWLELSWENNYIHSTVPSASTWQLPGWSNMKPKASYHKNHHHRSQKFQRCFGHFNRWRYQIPEFNRRGNLITFLSDCCATSRLQDESCTLVNSSCRIVYDVLSAAISISSPVFLRGAVGSVHFYWNELHYWTACVHCRNLRKEKTNRKCIWKFRRK